MKLPIANAEGHITLVWDEAEEQGRPYLETQSCLHIDETLVGRYPLESLSITQRLSYKSGVSHGLAAVQALESYLKIPPSQTVLKLRLVIHQLSMIHAHLWHFYRDMLPNYLNRRHLVGGKQRASLFPSDLIDRKADENDLSLSQGVAILGNLDQALVTINRLQLCLSLLGGKFPGIMSLTPGGMSMPSIPKARIMKILRLLESIKPFIEETWPQDVKKLIRDLPATTVNESKVKLNLISFGSMAHTKLKNHPAYYSPGVFVDHKLEPLNELKITESLQKTYYLPKHNSRNGKGSFYDPKKSDAHTWIKAARYETETMQTGALARMLVTHFGGGNLEVSDQIGQMIEDLGLPKANPNSIASRILAEVIESRFCLKSCFKTLMETNLEESLGSRIDLDFSRQGSGMGKIEAPGGALMHQVFIENNQISAYRIVSPMNWKFSSTDEFGKSGIVEQELIRQQNEDEFSAREAARMIHSYYVQALDGTL